jgi:hypothetical protein
MQRVGYDADTQTDTYVDQDGKFWEVDPGVRYGLLHRTGRSKQPAPLFRDSPADNLPPVMVYNGQTIEKKSCLTKFPSSRDRNNRSRLLQHLDSAIFREFKILIHSSANFKTQARVINLFLSFLLSTPKILIIKI